MGFRAVGLLLVAGILLDEELFFFLRFGHVACRGADFGVPTLGLKF